MLKRNSIRRDRNQRRPTGFTLVEMLVAVALVLIMMTMFAQVFVMSTASLSQQRGIAENDQRARLLTTTIRGDLDERTFRDVLPFRANEDTRLLGNSLARRAGYFEIDEGNPSDDTDDVLSFTASVNIRLQSKDGTPFTGNAQALSAIGTSSGAGANYSGIAVSAIGSTFSLADGGLYLTRVAVGSRIWAAGYPNTPYFVSSVVLSGGNTDINVSQTIAGSGAMNLYLSESEPDFDDGVFGNGNSISSLAEVCYFLRNGILYRRILLIRDKQPGANAQPTWTTGLPILWNNNVVPNSWNGSSLTECYSPTGTTTTFWRDFDYSAFFYTGNNNTGTAPGVRFHNASESLSNSNQPSQMFTNNSVMAGTSFPFSLGIPHWRFGHSTTNGLPQDASTRATLNGGRVFIGRFNLQECAYSGSTITGSSAFGYPGYLPIDPVTSANGNVSPFDRQNIQINPDTGLVAEYTNGAPFPRRGEDILLSNVLSFDVKVWDPLNGQMVDIGNSLAPAGPFSANVGVITDLNGNVVGGRLNSTYGSDGHFRFDTWHPNASVTTSRLPPGTPATLYNEPPYYNPVAAPSLPYTYNEPPYVPVALNQPQTLLAGVPAFEAAALSAIQIKINFRDISSNQIRQVTIVQSLVDRVKRTSVTNESAEE